MQDEKLQFLEAEYEITEAYIALKKEQIKRRTEEIKTLCLISGGSLALSLAIGFKIEHLACLGISIPIMLYHSFYINKEEKEQNGLRYARIGIQKKLRELEKNLNNTHNFLFLNKKEEERIREYLDLYYECGSNINEIVNPKFEQELKETYYMLEDKEIEKCILTLKPNREN